MQDKILIGLTGHTPQGTTARVGKDTVAHFLTQQHGFMAFSFADPLKRAAQIIFGLTDDEMDDCNKTKRIERWGMSFREICQKLGTEAGRQVFGEDLWIKRWELEYRFFADKADVVVRDVRFDNEAERIRKNGGVIVHIYRDHPDTDMGAASGHASEAGVKIELGDRILNNDGSLNDLAHKVNMLVLGLLDEEVRLA